MTRWIPLLLALAGCAPTVCDHAAEWADRCDVPWTDADTRSCSVELKACTRKEREKLDLFWACMDARGFFECRDAPSDTGSGKSPESAAVPTAEDLRACEAELVGVPVSCSTAIGLDGGTFANLGTTDPTGATTTSP